SGCRRAGPLFYFACHTRWRRSSSFSSIPDRKRRRSGRRRNSLRQSKARRWSTRGTTIFSPCFSATVSTSTGVVSCANASPPSVPLYTNLSLSADGIGFFPCRTTKPMPCEVTHGLCAKDILSSNHHPLCVVGQVFLTKQPLKKSLRQCSIYARAPYVVQRQHEPLYP